MEGILVILDRQKIMESFVSETKEERVKIAQRQSSGIGEGAFIARSTLTDVLLLCD